MRGGLGERKFGLPYGDSQRASSLLRCFRLKANVRFIALRFNKNTELLRCSRVLSYEGYGSDRPETGFLVVRIRRGEGAGNPKRKWRAGPPKISVFAGFVFAGNEIFWGLVFARL